MRRLITTLAVVFAAFAASSGRALADPVQSANQSSSTGQAAIAASSATQVQPSNENISVRVLSPGSDGAVSQSNSATSTATATNTAAPTQSANQTQAGGCGCAPVVRSGDIGDVLGTAMQAAAAQPQQQAAATPAAPAPATSQTNEATSAGTATNAAPTAQTATQSGSSGGSGVQSSTQDAATHQGAVAASSAAQEQPSNSNVSVRVLSPGSDGNVTQSNSATSHADASNSATTTQAGSQSGTGGGVQSSTQSADTHQGALGLSSATQDHPSNSNVAVRVLSPGNGGSVTQSNSADSSAHATNTAPVTQIGSQTQSGTSCGCAGSGQGVQSSTQSSGIDQGALAASSAQQLHPSNSSEPVRIGSQGSGGSVDQSNDASSTAAATNAAPVVQTGTQAQAGMSCGCSAGAAVQAAGQSSHIGQLGIGLSSAGQFGASNSSGPVRIGSAGNDGSTDQSNDATSTATSTNTAPVTQAGTQTQPGSLCGCSSGTAVQALGQSSDIGQLGAALSSAKQIGAGNESGPVRIGSDGNGGSVTQSNDATSSAAAANSAPASQTGTQTQGGAGIQALGQESWVGQAALAASSAAQFPGESRCGCGGSPAWNSADPARIGSAGSDGAVTQSNSATSAAHAPNAALPTQTATQTQAGASCGCGGHAVQALGQHGDVQQLAAAFDTALQGGARNSSAPTRIWDDAAPSSGDVHGMPDGRILQPGQLMLV